jgi:hypothetical protein
MREENNLQMFENTLLKGIYLKTTPNWTIYDTIGG